jgi:outer membrane protein OmpA-like peptidoglycan-associated protein
VIRRVAFALPLAIAMSFHHPVKAQFSRPIGPLPSDCLSLLGRKKTGGLATWQSTVLLEHCDRIKRLQRLSVLLPPDEQPRFFESVIPHHRLPADYGVDIPVLRVVFPDRVFFDTAKSALRPEAQEIARIIAESLRRELPDVTLFVAGHADSRGDADYNEALSISRADTVATTIFRYGINLGTVWRIGFGEDMPLVAGQHEAAWGQNRRIEFLFSAKPEPIGVWLADQQQHDLCQSRNTAESTRCKAGLELRPDYEAARVENLDPGTRTRTSPVRRRQQVAQTSNRRKDVSPAKSERVVVIPRNAPRLVINLTNRQAEAVRVSN